MTYDKKCGKCGRLMHKNADMCRYCIENVQVTTPAQDGDKREWNYKGEIERKVFEICERPSSDKKWSIMQSCYDIMDLIRSIESRTAERTLAEAREVVENNKVSVPDLYDTKTQEGYMVSVRLIERAQSRNETCDDIARALTKKK